MLGVEAINKESVILGSKEKYDLRFVPFSRKGSYMCILEDKKDRNLYLSFSRSPGFLMERKNLVKIVPVVDNKELSYEYSVEPGKMSIKTYRGAAEICFADKSQIRIRGEGINLRFYFRMQQFENCSPKENGDFEVAYEILGKLLFVPIKGAVWCNAKWNCKTVQAEDFIIELISPVETKKFETAIHEYCSNGTRDKEYKPFDVCVKEVEEEFEKFCERFRMVPDKYAKMAQLSAWTIWVNYMGPEGHLKNSLVYMNRINQVRAFLYQQCFQAMAFCGNITEMWKMFLSMFDYQKEGGQLPYYVSDLNISYLAACTPVHGAAMEYIFNVSDPKNLKQDKITELYFRMSKYAEWFLTKRDRNKSGIPQYYHPDESSWIDLKAFKNIRPVQSADLLALMVLLTEYSGKLANMAGFESEADKWFKESRRLINILESEFWNGEKFISKDAQTGECVETGPMASLLPVILGKRLRREIIDTIEKRLEKEAENLNILSPAWFLIIMGIKNAGKKELALDLARQFCDLVCNIAGNNTDKNEGENTEPNKVEEFTSEMAAAFLITASYLPDEE